MDRSFTLAGAAYREMAQTLERWFAPDDVSSMWLGMKIAHVGGSFDGFITGPCRRGSRIVRGRTGSPS